MSGVKLVFTGDGAVGKTALLLSFTSGKFPEEYVPTICANFTKNIVINSKRIKVRLWDTAGQEDYDRLRPLSYNNADCVLVCFAVNEPDSLKNASKKWIPEARSNLPNVPVILVGLKTDMREQVLASAYSSAQIEEKQRTPEPVVVKVEPTGKSFAPSKRKQQQQQQQQQYYNQDQYYNQENYYNQDQYYQQAAPPSKKQGGPRTPGSKKKQPSPQSVGSSRSATQSSGGDYSSGKSSSKSRSARSKRSSPKQRAMNGPIGGVNAEQQLYNSPVAKFISTEEGQRAAKDAGANAYLECSAKTQVGVNSLFEKSTAFAINYKKGSDCCTML